MSGGFRIVVFPNTVFKSFENINLPKINHLITKYIENRIIINKTTL